MKRIIVSSSSLLTIISMALTDTSASRANVYLSKVRRKGAGKSDKGREIDIWNRKTKREKLDHRSV